MTAQVMLELTMDLDKKERRRGIIIRPQCRFVRDVTKREKPNWGTQTTYKRHAVS